MKIINITILAVQGSVVRAYLDAMKAAGFSPKKIIDVRLKPWGRKYRFFANFLGGKISSELLCWFASRRRNLAKNRALCDKLMANSDHEINFFGKIDYSDYASEVEKISVTNFSDPFFLEYLSRQDCKTFIFTGGGILRAGLLNLPDVRFLHIHPGITPAVKGSDGLFWSVLIRNKPGYSCFYMNEGIDTGDVILTREFDYPSFSISNGQYSYDVLYRALLDFYDPWLRSCLLVEVLRNFSSVEDFKDIPVVKQNPSEGRTYFFMHPKLRDSVINRMLK